MPRRFFELAVRARRFVGRSPDSSRTTRRPRLTAHRQLGNELTQFSFRLAFVIDLAYVGLGALGGAAVGRATSPDAAGRLVVPACADTIAMDGLAHDNRTQTITNSDPSTFYDLVYLSTKQHTELARHRMVSTRRGRRWTIESDDVVVSWDPFDATAYRRH